MAIKLFASLKEFPHSSLAVQLLYSATGSTLHFLCLFLCFWVWEEKNGNRIKLKQLIFTIDKPIQSVYNEVEYHKYKQP